MKRIGVLLLLTVLFASCKSTKDAGTESVTAMSSKKIINNHYNESFDENTLNGTIKAKYQDKNSSHSVGVSYRIQKDSAIWMSGRMLNITLAKIFITPTKVQFYEKLGKTYFEGDFALLSDFLGTEVDFEIVQNLLLGQAIVDLKEQKFNASVDENSYKLEPKKQADLFDLLFWMNPTNFKVSKQEVRRPDIQKKLTIDYVEYQEVQEEMLPKKINITAVDGVERVFLNLEYKSVQFNNNISFPFSIPRGYEQIQLNE